MALLFPLGVFILLAIVIFLDDLRQKARDAEYRKNAEDEDRNIQEKLGNLLM